MLRKKLFGYIAGILTNIGCDPIAVGGHIDHVHILCNLSKTISLSKAMELTKSNSSRWIKTQDDKYKYFGWQNGYGAFSVDKRQLAKVKSYILDQGRVHSNLSFQNEMIEIE